MKFPERISNPLADIMARLALPEAAKLIGVKPEELLEAIRIARSENGYTLKKIPKRRGGFRLIEKPADGLKAVQKAAHENFLRRRYLPTPICHSFVGKRYDSKRDLGKRWLWGRTIVSAAFAHLGVPPDKEPQAPDIYWRHPKALFSVDMKDAYPTLKANWVSEIYREICGDEWSAKFLTDLSVRNGALPQGAPTSPLLFNLACRKLDQALWEEFEGQNLFPDFRVTRYVDDITLTSLSEKIGKREKERLVKIVEAHGFKINPDKICDWEERSRVLRILSLDLDPKERRVFLPREALERLRFLSYHSLRILKEANLEWILEGGREKISLKNFHTKKEMRALGRLLGIVGFSSMIYEEEEIPRRIFSWHKEFPRWNPEVFSNLLRSIKQGTLIADPHEVAWDLYRSAA